MAWELPVKRVKARVGAHARTDVEAEAAALITQIEVPTLDKACQLLAFWNERRAEGVVVGRDVPSRALAPLLRCLVLFEPVDEGRDLRIRLAGTSLLRRYGRDVSGSLVSALYSREHFKLILGRANQVLAAKTPQIDDVVIRNSERTLQHFETVHLPVYSPDGSAMWDMAGYFYFP